MDLTLATPAVRTQIDLRAIELRRRDLQDFRNFPEVQHFRAEARNGTVPPPSLSSILMIGSSDIKPLETPRIASKGHAQCDLGGISVRAWSLGTIGSCDHDAHAAYGEHLAADNHELHITERGDIASLTPQLEHEGKVVVSRDGLWPIKALVPFDISKLCNCSLNTIMERVQSLADVA